MRKMHAVARCTPHPRLAASSLFLLLGLREARKVAQIVNATAQIVMKRPTIRIAWSVAFNGVFSTNY